MPETDRYNIEVLDIALKVVEAMGLNQVEGHSPAALARQFKINRSRMFRILKTMHQRGFVDYDLKTETYRLGLKFLTVSQNVREQLSLHREAEEILRSLAAETGDSSYLLISSGHSAIVIDRYAGENMLQMSAPIGASLPFHVGAAPKVLLAFMPEQKREKILREMDMASYTSNTVTDKATLRKTLDDIRRNGFSVDEQDYEVGAYAFGAPVFDHEGSIAAGVSITTPTARCSSERRVELIAKIQLAARQLSRKLGYQENPGKRIQ